MSTELARSKCELDMKVASNRQFKPISATVIRLNNFVLYGSTGCVLPYLSVYFLHYTQASSNDVGIFMLISSIVGILTSLLLSSLADRYQAYRLVYLGALMAAYTSYLILAIPMVSMSAGGNTTDGTEINSDANEALPTDESVALEAERSNLSVSAGPVDVGLVPPDNDQGQHWTTKIDQFNVAWFYIIGICIVIGNMASAVSMSYCDSFSANMARMQQEAKAITGRQASSFGSLRCFGSVGWCVASLSLSLINKQAPHLPYLLTPWLLFFLLASINIFLILFWPDKRPFDLANSDALGPEVDGQQNVATVHDEPRTSGAHWWTTRTLLMGNRNRGYLSSEVFRDCNRKVQLVEFTSHPFDERTHDDEMAARYGQQNVRRCSIAPLGNSYMCEQFVITNSNKDTQVLHDETGHQETHCHRHFKYIVKIEPIKVSQLERVAKSAPEAGFETTSSMSDVETAKPRLDSASEHLQDGQVFGKVAANVLGRQEPLEPIGFWLYLKIIELIARRNKNVLRFMLLYIMIGLIVSMNIIYLLPYLESLNEHQFRTLGPQVMISCYLSEAFFYYFSSRITNKLSAANGLTLVLLVFAGRYLLYITFSLWPADIWPLELVIGVELLQSISHSWFECILNESALEFALEAEHCVPELIGLKLIANTPESIDQVRNSVKLALFSLSSCCFDGIGIGFGSLAGGWIIHQYGYSVLWAGCAAFAITIAFANILIELIFFRGPPPMPPTLDIMLKEPARSNSSYNHAPK